MIGPKIKFHRRSRQLTQASMARELGVRQPSYAKFERKSANPRYSTLVKIASVFDIEVWELVK